MHHAFQAHGAAGGSGLPEVSEDTITAEELLEKQAKWHRNVRRTLPWDRLANTTTCQANHREPPSSCISNTGQRDSPLFCEEEASGKRPLQLFQKLCLTEEMITKALLMHDWKELNELKELWRYCG